MSLRINASRLRFKEYLNRTARSASQPALAATPAPIDYKETAEGQRRSGAQRLNGFFNILRTQRWSVIVALALSTISIVLKLAPPMIFKICIDDVFTEHRVSFNFASWLALPSDKWQLIVVLAVGMTIISLLAIAIDVVARWNSTRATKMVYLALSKRVFQRAAQMPLERIQALKIGGMVSILRDDVTRVSELVSSAIFVPWQAVVQLFGSLLVLAIVDWRLLCGALALLPLVFITHRSWASRLNPLFLDIHSLRQQIDGHNTETFGGMRVVRAFGRQRHESHRFALRSNLLVRHERHAWWRFVVIEVLWGASFPLLVGGLVLFGGLEILSGKLSLGALTMFVMYMGMLFTPLASITVTAMNLQSGMASLDRVLNLLDEPPEFHASPPTHFVDAATTSGQISFRNIGFRYPGSGALALQEITFDVQPGELIALVGPSGAGKTTLCNLIARFYDPTHGTITLDGVDLREIEVSSYRRLLGIVDQDVFLFDGTVGENISYGNTTATMDDIRAAAKAANAHEFIVALEEGYDAKIGERGVCLSAGQRQRISIARALLADPRILIFDEPTSSLDTESERCLQESLSLLVKERTCFVISHRLSTIAHADRILVFKQGRIVETGTHAALIQNGVHYHEMLRQQIENSSRIDGHLPNDTVAHMSASKKIFA